MSMSYHFKHLVIDTYTQKRIRQRQDEKSSLPITVPYPSIHNRRKHPRTQTLPILSFSWIKLSTRYVMFLPITKMLSLTVLSHFQNCPNLGLVSASFMTDCCIPKTHSTSAGRARIHSLIHSSAEAKNMLFVEHLLINYNGDARIYPVA